MDCTDIHTRLEDFYNEEPDRVFVDHPASPRYSRAHMFFRELIQDGTALGVGTEVKNNEMRIYILVLFLGPGPEDALEGLKGQYAAFKIMFKPPSDTRVIYGAELFAFYDDDPIGDDGNHGMSSEGEARAFMKRRFPNYISSEVFYDND